MKSMKFLTAALLLAGASAAQAQLACNTPLGVSMDAMPESLRFCSAGATLPPALLAPTDTAFANVLFAPAPIVAGINTHVLNAFPASLALRGATNASLFSMDLSADGNTLFGAVVSNAAAPPANNRTLGTINQTTGAYTVVGNITGLVDQANENAADLAINPSTNVAYLLTNAGAAPAITSRLYTVNLATGALTLVGAQANNPSFLIDLAVNCQGQIFGHRFSGTAGGNSELVSVSPTNGAVTVVGSTGFPANFAQGMDFDAQANTLYMWQFAATTAADAVVRYGTVNTATGALTPIFTSAAGAGIEIEGAIRSSCAVAGPVVSTPVPTNSTWALSLMALLLAGVGLISARRFS
jgi:hypothetical protein